MVREDDVAGVANGVVVRVVGVGAVCTLVQAAIMSTLPQITTGGFMTIESSRRNGRPATRNSH